MTLERSDLWQLCREVRLGGASSVAALASITVASAGLPVLLAVATGHLAREVVAARELGDVAGPLGFVVALFAGVLLLPAVTATALPALGRRLDHVRSQMMMTALLAPIGIAHLEEPATRDDIARARGAGTGITAGAALPGMVNVMTARLQGIAAIVVLGAIRWWLALPTLVVHVVFMRFWDENYRRLTSWALQRTPDLRRGDWFRDTSMGVAAAKEIRLFGLGNWFADGFHANWLAGMSSVWTGWRRRRWQVALAIAVPTAATLLLTAAAGQAAVDRDLSFLALVITLQALALAGTLSAPNDAGRVVPAGAAAARAGRELIVRLKADEEARAQHPPAATGGPDSPGDIRFEDVSFRYPGRDTWALRHLDLEVRARRSLAIVGSNGAGKTTIVRLLCRLIEPTEGRITVGGVPIDDLDPRAWRSQLAVVFQDFARHPFTVRENVAVGRLATSATDAGLEEAAERAGAGALVERLPRGWDTVLSRQVTDGTDLSGGEWQRIAMARALFAVHGGARVLMLDEPAASLDVRAEAEMYDRFLELTEGLTSIVISHRFSTVRQADGIVVIDGGRVVESGSHQTLMSAKGRYADLFALQAARFG